MTPGASDYYVPGLIVVGFDKSYTTAQAVQVMEDTGLEYYKTRNVNRGKAFDRATGELFLVRVPEGEEEDYIEEFDSLPFIYAAGEYLDPDQVQID